MLATRAVISKLIFLTIFVLQGLLLHGQGVAVVLSGGGSRGVAHIGVLKALEENDIPIHYIAGTSIGAAVGAFYAAGYTPEEIEKIFASADFENRLNGGLPSGYTFYFRNDDADAGWIDLRLDFSNRNVPLLPSTLISPVALDFSLLDFLAGASAAANYNFDDLMVPFLCIASDIDSSKAVVLRKGHLSEAVRASITFPLLFKPIEINGRLLFDGGMYNNFPSDIVLEKFNPEIIIGSKVSGNYPRPDPDNLLLQIQNMLMTKTDFGLDTTIGILIEPPVKQVNLTDFSLFDEFVLNGYDETIKSINKIRSKLSGIEKGIPIEIKRKEFAERKPAYHIDSIRIKGVNEKQKRYVYKALVHHSRQITLEEMEPYFYRLAADNQLMLSGVSMDYVKDAGVYRFNLKIKPANKFLLKFGGNISSRIANQAFVELKYQNLFRNAFTGKANLYFGRFYTSALMGARLDFTGKTPIYFGGNLVYNHFDFFKSSIHFIEDITPSFLILDDNYFRAYAGIPAGSGGKLEFSLGLGRQRKSYYQTNIFSREDTADVTKFDFVNPGLTWELNSLNRKQYADAGAMFSTSVCYVSGNEEFISGSKTSTQSGQTAGHNRVCLDIVWDNYFGWLGPFKLGFYGRLYLSDQKFYSNYTASVLAAPQFEPIPESRTLFLPYFRAYNFAGGGLKTILKISRRIDFRNEIYLFQPYQQIIKSDDNTAALGEALSKRYWMGNSALVYHTLIGPVSLSVNYFENPEEKIFVALNIGYIIFNRRALE
jgi:NTE family protein